MGIKDSLAAGDEEEEFGNGNSFMFSLEDKYVDDEAANQPQTSMQRNLYWESQEALLQEILENYKLSCAKVREGINKVIERISTQNCCDCPLPKLENCAKCLRLRAVDELRNKGFTATLCTSKWNRNGKKLGGRHEYIEVTEGRKKQVRLVIELKLRDEFKMGRSSEEYCRMVEKLPEMYVGKAEYLNAIVRVVCDAAKKSASEQRIHMGPWRTANFMLMKWSASVNTSFLMMSQGPQSLIGTTLKVA